MGTGGSSGGGGGGGAGGVVGTDLQLTSGQVDSAIKDINGRFGFQQPRGVLESNEGVLSHARGVNAVSSRIFGANDRGSVTTTSRRLTGAQTGTGRSGTEVVSTITGDRGALFTVTTRGFAANQGGPSISSVSISGRARRTGRSMPTITRQQGEDSARFRSRVQNEVGRHIDLVAYKTVGG